MFTLTEKSWCAQLKGANESCHFFFLVPTHFSYFSHHALSLTALIETFKKHNKVLQAATAVCGLSLLHVRGRREHIPG